MTLDKAIHILEYHISQRGYDRLPPKVDALKLGIGALKRIKDIRSGKRLSAQSLLPGETKEDAS